jgi:hypothetical protein
MSPRKTTERSEVNNPRIGQVIEHDRGLGSAYERWHFYRLLDKWANEYDVETAVEGPVDGMAGVSGVHLVGLARRGIRVTAALPNEATAGVARAVYDGSGVGNLVDVRIVADPMSAASQLPACDLVVAYHSLPLVDDWRGYLQQIAKLAKKAIVVTVCNPDNWGVTAVRLTSVLRGLRGFSPPDVWHTEILAPELWSVGRVRDHVYFDAPWWPDLPVAPGQSLLDRARQLAVQRRSEVRYAGDVRGAKLAERFVYGPAKWPYFGGAGWKDELEPALRRHPSFERAHPKLGRHVAHLHAFVVDTRPRTPQARRRLAVSDRDTSR